MTKLKFFIYCNLGWFFLLDSRRNIDTTASPFRNNSH